MMHGQPIIKIFQCISITKDNKRVLSRKLQYRCTLAPRTFIQPKSKLTTQEIQVKIICCWHRYTFFIYLTFSLHSLQYPFTHSTLSSATTLFSKLHWKVKPCCNTFTIYFSGTRNKKPIGYARMMT
jgi:hypothetical protein